MRAQARSSTPWTTLFFALLGLAWCGYVAFPTTTPIPCASSGCALLRDSRLAGISLWWVGGAYFFTLAIVCLRGNYKLARMLARLALVLDAALLAIMFFIAPCLDCLIAAIFMGLCYYSLRPSAHQIDWFIGDAPSSSMLLAIWAGLLVGNMALVANEQLPLYNMGKSHSKDLSIFFSPSCRACREALTTLGQNAALYPVVESDADVESIVRLGALLKADTPIKEALRLCLDRNEPMPALSLYDRALLQVQLLRNKAALMRQGYRALPLILINGMPGQTPNAPLERSALNAPSAPLSTPRNPEAPPANDVPPPSEPGRTKPLSEDPGQTQGALPDFLNEPNQLLRCGGEGATPCD